MVFNYPKKFAGRTCLSVSQQDTPPAIADFHGMNLTCLYLAIPVCCAQKNTGRSLKSFSVWLSQDQNQTALRCHSCCGLWVISRLPISLALSCARLPWEAAAPGQSPLRGCAGVHGHPQLYLLLWWRFAGDFLCRSKILICFMTCAHLCLSCWKRETRSAGKLIIFSASPQGHLVLLQ